MLAKHCSNTVFEIARSLSKPSLTLYPSPPTRTVEDHGSTQRPPAKQTLCDDPTPLSRQVGLQDPWESVHTTTKGYSVYSEYSLHVEWQWYTHFDASCFLYILSESHHVRIFLEPPYTLIADYV